MGLRLQRAATDARFSFPNLLVSPDTCDVPGTPRRNYTHEAPLLTNVVEGLSRRQTRAVPLLKTARCTLSTASAVTAPLFWLRPNAPGTRFTPHAGGDGMTVFLQMVVLSWGCGIEVSDQLRLAESCIPKKRERRPERPPPKRDTRVAAPVAPGPRHLRVHSAKGPATHATGPGQSQMTSDAQLRQCHRGTIPKRF